MATINPNIDITANTGVDIEDLLDKIADELIIDSAVNPSLVASNQKTIRNGLVQLGRNLNDKLLLYQKDVKANEEDFNKPYIQDATGESGLSALRHIASNLPPQINNITVDIGHDGTSGKINSILVSSSLNGGASYELFNILVDLETGNPLNISQFISINKQKTIVNPEQAREYLDTNIYELLPTGDTRQARIIRFFQELNTLLPNEIPQFDITGSEIQGPDGRVDRDEFTGKWIGTEDYDKRYSISYAQDNIDGFIQEEEAFIHRLKNENANDTNESRTIEDIYNVIRPYLDDILEDELLLQDERPVYQNQSNGYLQFRNLNQSIIIRNTNQEFINGLNPNNKEYLDTGFTITMWVRFLDKTSEGTLFNFGNPTREENPFGFKLETFVDTEKTNRYLRLLVYDDIGTSGVGVDNNPHWYDSHVGNEFGSKQPITTSYHLTYVVPQQYTSVPIDFTEWYFICATYNINIDEINSDMDNISPEYWINHINEMGDFISNSGFGNRCKVEIISKTDLLRSRGFKV